MSASCGCFRLSLSTPDRDHPDPLFEAALRSGRWRCAADRERPGRRGRDRQRRPMGIWVSTALTVLREYVNAGANPEIHPVDRDCRLGARGCISTTRNLASVTTFVRHASAHGLMHTLGNRIPAPIIAGVPRHRAGRLLRRRVASGDLVFTLARFNHEPRSDAGLLPTASRRSRRSAANVPVCGPAGGA